MDDLKAKEITMENKKSVVIPSEKMMEKIKTTLPDLTLIEQISKKCEQAMSDGIKIAESISKNCATFSYQVNPALIEAFQRINEENLRIAKIIEPALQNLENIQAIASPFFDWLQSIDVSLHINATDPQKKLSIDQSCYKRQKQDYLQVMHDERWFPYAGWRANIRLMFAIIEIINTSTEETDRTIQIDNAVLDYYTDLRIKEIVEDWNRIEIDQTRKRILSQSVDAFYRKEYALTTICLATMWEGLVEFVSKKDISFEKGQDGHVNAKSTLKKLIEDNNYNKVFSDYYINYIFSHCYKPEETIEGVPNRHASAHGWYMEYPNRKAALNAILLTDFILHLEPVSD